MKFISIWISSIEHLNKFNYIAPSGTNAYEIKSRMPELFPSLQTQGFIVPLAYFSFGEIEFMDDALVYKAKEQRGFFSNFINLDSKLTFSIKYSEINNIGSYYVEGYNPNYAIQWIRIMHCSESIGNNILISTGASGLFAMKKIKTSNDEIISLLRKMVQS